MKTNTKWLSIGLLIVGLIAGVYRTTIAAPANKATIPEPQSQAEDIVVKTGAFRVVGDACTALTSTDGVTWKRVLPQGETNCRGMAHGSGTFGKGRAE